MLWDLLTRTLITCGYLAGMFAVGAFLGHDWHDDDFA